MNAKPNPIHRSGYRNVQCPLYHGCLDHAAKRFWKGWDCSNCYFKKMAEEFEEIICCEDSADLYYSIPAQIFSDLE